MRVNFHRQGSGPPLLLLHGVGHHWQAWRPVIDLLSGEFDVIAADSPGFGRSESLPPGVEPSIPAYAGFFAGFIEDLGVERPHVAGNSMGGAIALELARQGAVASVTAFSPAGFWSPSERRFCQRSLSMLGGLPESFRPAIRALARTRPGRIALFRQTVGWPARTPAEEAVATLDDAWASPSFEAALAAFDGYDFIDGDEIRGTPTTVAWGFADRLLIYKKQAPRAKDALPWARHLTLGAGHVPFHDDPGACAEVIRRTAAQAAG